MDRNAFVRLIVPELTVSLSARRAWIEIGCTFAVQQNGTIALRKESVDRNIMGAINEYKADSLSARRAWIEILR